MLAGFTNKMLPFSGVMFVFEASEKSYSSNNLSLVCNLVGDISIGEFVLVRQPMSSRTIKEEKVVFEAKRLY